MGNEDAEKGLYVKYVVRKIDAEDVLENCFVLRPDRDPAAVIALRAYARATRNGALAADILQWVGDYQPLTLEEVLALAEQTSLDKRPFTWVWYQSLERWDNHYMDYTGWKTLQKPMHKPDSIAVLSTGTRYEMPIADYGVKYSLYLHRPIVDPRY